MNNDNKDRQQANPSKNSSETIHDQDLDAESDSDITDDQESNIENDDDGNETFFPFEDDETIVSSGNEKTPTLSSSSPTKPPSESSARSVSSENSTTEIKTSPSALINKAIAKELRSAFESPAGSSSAEKSASVINSSVDSQLDYNSSNASNASLASVGSASGENPASVVNTSVKHQLESKPFSALSALLKSAGYGSGENSASVVNTPAASQQLDIADALKSTEQTKTNVSVKNKTASPKKDKLSASKSDTSIQTNISNKTTIIAIQPTSLTRVSGFDIADQSIKNTSSRPFLPIRGNNAPHKWAARKEAENTKKQDVVQPSSPEKEKVAFNQEKAYQIYQDGKDEASFLAPPESVISPSDSSSDDEFFTGEEFVFTTEVHDKALFHYDESSNNIASSKDKGKAPAIFDQEEYSPSASSKMLRRTSSPINMKDQETTSHPSNDIGSTSEANPTSRALGGVAEHSSLPHVISEKSKNEQQENKPIALNIGPAPAPSMNQVYGTTFMSKGIVAVSSNEIQLRLDAESKKKRLRTKSLQGVSAHSSTSKDANEPIAERKKRRNARSQIKKSTQQIPEVTQKAENLRQEKSASSDRGSKANLVNVEALSRDLVLNSQLIISEKKPLDSALAPKKEEMSITSEGEVLSSLIAYKSKLELTQPLAQSSFIMVDDKKHEEIVDQIDSNLAFFSNPLAANLEKLSPYYKAQLKNYTYVNLADIGKAFESSTIQLPISLSNANVERDILTITYGDNFINKSNKKLLKDNQYDASILALIFASALRFSTVALEDIFVPENNHTDYKVNLTGLVVTKGHYEFKFTANNKPFTIKLLSAQYYHCAREAYTCYQQPQRFQALTLVNHNDITLFKTTSEIDVRYGTYDLDQLESLLSYKKEKQNDIHNLEIIKARNERRQLLKEKAALKQTYEAKVAGLQTKKNQLEMNVSTAECNLKNALLVLVKTFKAEPTIYNNLNSLINPTNYERCIDELHVIAELVNKKEKVTNADLDDIFKIITAWHKVLNDLNKQASVEADIFDQRNCLIDKLNKLNMAIKCAIEVRDKQIEELAKKSPEIDKSLKKVKNNFERRSKKIQQNIDMGNEHLQLLERTYDDSRKFSPRVNAIIKTSEVPPFLTGLDACIKENVAKNKQAKDNIVGYLDKYIEMAKSKKLSLLQRLLPKAVHDYESIRDRRIVFAEILKNAILKTQSDQERYDVLNDKMNKMKEQNLVFTFKSIESGESSLYRLLLDQKAASRIRVLISTIAELSESIKETKDNVFLAEMTKEKIKLYKQIEKIIDISSLRFNEEGYILSGKGKNPLLIKIKKELAILETGLVNVLAKIEQEGLVKRSNNKKQQHKSSIPLQLAYQAASDARAVYFRKRAIRKVLTSEPIDESMNGHEFGSPKIEEKINEKFVSVNEEINRDHGIATNLMNIISSLEREKLTDNISVNIDPRLKAGRSPLSSTAAGITNLANYSRNLVTVNTKIKHYSTEYASQLVATATERAKETQQVDAQNDVQVKNALNNILDFQDKFSMASNSIFPMEKFSLKNDISPPTPEKLLPNSSLPVARVSEKKESLATSLGSAPINGSFSGTQVHMGSKSATRQTDKTAIINISEELIKLREAVDEDKPGNVLALQASFLAEAGHCINKLETYLATLDKTAKQLHDFEQKMTEKEQHYAFCLDVSGQASKTIYEKMVDISSIIKELHGRANKLLKRKVKLEQGLKELKELQQKVFDEQPTTKEECKKLIEECDNSHHALEIVYGAIERVDELSNHRKQNQKIPDLAKNVNLHMVSVLDSLARFIENKNLCDQQKFDKLKTSPNWAKLGKKEISQQALDDLFSCKWDIKNLADLSKLAQEKINGFIRNLGYQRYQAYADSKLKELAATYYYIVTHRYEPPFNSNHADLDKIEINKVCRSLLRMMYVIGGKKAFHALLIPIFYSYDCRDQIKNLLMDACDYEAHDGKYAHLSDIVEVDPSSERSQELVKTNSLIMIPNDERRKDETYFKEECDRKAKENFDRYHVNVRRFQVTEMLQFLQGTSAPSQKIAKIENIQDSMSKLSHDVGSGSQAHLPHSKSGDVGYTPQLMDSTKLFNIEELELLFNCLNTIKEIIYPTDETMFLGKIKQVLGYAVLSDNHVDTLFETVHHLLMSSIFHNKGSFEAINLICHKLINEIDTHLTQSKNSIQLRMFIQILSVIEIAAKAAIKQHALRTLQPGENRLTQAFQFNFSRQVVKCLEKHKSKQGLKDLGWLKWENIANNKNLAVASAVLTRLPMSEQRVRQNTLNEQVSNAFQQNANKVQYAGHSDSQVTRDTHFTKPGVVIGGQEKEYRILSAVEMNI